MMDILMEMLMPFMMILAFIFFIIASVYLIWMIICIMKKKRNNDGYEMIEEIKESYDESTVYRAIITIGNEKIEIEVDDYDIEETIIKIETKDEKLYLTDTKNVVLISDKKEIF
ncbi:hypothetical protein I9Y31_003313 [Clostridium perfringens]|nr:hypothetical protein [Clostridium perfringens]